MTIFYFFYVILKKIAQKYLRISISFGNFPLRAFFEKIVGTLLRLELVPEQQNPENKSSTNGWRGWRLPVRLSRRKIPFLRRHCGRNVFDKNSISACFARRQILNFQSAQPSDD